VTRPDRRRAPSPPNLGAGFVELGADVIVPPGVALPPAAKEVETNGFFADVDGDGAQDVVVSYVGGQEFDPPRTTVYGYRDRRLYRRPDLPIGNVMVLAILDIDGDGAVDVLTSRDPMEVAWGLPSGGFAAPAVVASARPREETCLRHGAAVDDIDGDGWLDVLLTSGCLPTAPQIDLLLQTAPRAFELSTDRVVQRSGDVDAVATLPSQNGPLLVSVKAGGPDGGGLNVYGRSGDVFQAFSVFAAGTRPPAVPMGVACGDLDGDGLLDLTVSDDPSHRYYAGSAAGWSEVTDRTLFEYVLADSLVAMKPWGMAFLDLDRDGRLDVVTTHGNDAGSWSNPPEYIGPQHTTAHWNAGGFEFTPIRSGLERRGQWKALTVGDLDADGAPDLIVGGQSESPRVYRNDIALGHGFGVRLHGTTSNPAGIGAIVDVWPTDGAPRQRYLAGSVGSPAAFFEPLVFVGIGAQTSAARVEVRWPSGTLQSLTDVAAGSVHDIIEPPVVTLEPATRRVTADGHSFATVRVIPRNVSTSAAPRISVSLQGGGTVGDPIHDDDGSLFRVTAPSSPGSAVLTVSIDGVPVGVRPRIWWTARPPA